MKQFIKYLLPIVLLGTAVSCSKDLTDPSNPYTGNFTLRSQAEVEAFGARENANRITVTGADITDLSPLDVAAVGTLVIRNTGIGELVLPNVTSIATRIEISNNESLTALRELGLKFSIGDMVIGDNPLLTDISGMMGLKKMSGKLIVTGNSLLGEDNPEEPETYGFNVIKHLVDNAVLRADRVTLSNNHPLAATDASLIGQGGSGDGVFSYTVKSDSEAANLSIKGTEVKDLIVTGAAVTDEGMAQLASKITAVKGTVTIDGASLKTTETFFGKVECRGGIVLRNITTYDTDGTNKFFNTNGFKGITHIYGDFILENIPYMIHWGAGNGFAQIKQIDGNFTVRNSGMQQLAFRSLETVGGNLTIDNNSLELYTGFFWNLITDLKSVGGNFTYTNNDHVNGLGGMEKITRIGGEVTITGNGTDVSAGGGIPYKTAPGQVGFDLVEKWITTGVVQYGATVDCRYADGTAVEFSEVPEPDEYKSYTVTGRAELLAFAPQDGSAVKETVQDLTIRGNGDQISDSDMSFVKTRVEKVRGTLTIEGISGLSTTEILLLTNGEGFTVDGGIVFRNCPELMNLNGMKSLTAIGGDLIFENCPKIATVWGAGNCLSQIQSVAGNLEISGVATDMAGITLLSLQSVGGDMTISNNNGNFWNLSEMKLKTVGGKLNMLNNSKVNGLGGFGEITSIGGDVTITGNGTENGGIPFASVAGQVGFDLVARWLETGAVGANAKVNCKYADGTLVVFSKTKSYTLTGRTELLAFASDSYSGAKETVNNLTIRGNGDQISDTDMSFLKKRVAKVEGTFMVEGVSGLSTTEILLLTNGEGFTVDGGIVFRNCPELMNLNGMKSLTAIGGDLIFENCPKIATIWGPGNCLSQIQSVAGSLKLIGVSEGINGLTFLSLKSVGGDMVISGNTGNFWNFNDGMKVETIGGGLTIANNAKLNGLGGFEALTSVGGNVTVSGNGGPDGYIPVQTHGNQTGLAILGQHYKAGVFASGAVFTIESNGVNYQIAEL